MVATVVNVVVSPWRYCVTVVFSKCVTVAVLLESLWCHCSHPGATIVTAAPLLRHCGHSEVAVVITIVTVVVSLWWYLCGDCGGTVVTVVVLWSLWWVLLWSLWW